MTTWLPPTPCWAQLSIEMLSTVNVYPTLHDPTARVQGIELEYSWP
ncbi:MAG TPA: hypothetical protein VGO93_03125 [Candidatus Xenobia bacterium]